METQNEKAPSDVDYPVLIVRRREFTNRLIEMYLWPIASMVVAGGIFVDILAGRAPGLEVISKRYVEFLLAFLTFFFPWIFRLIFGALPLESLRRKRAQRQLEASDKETSVGTDIRNAEIQVLSDAMSTDDLAFGGR